MSRDESNASGPVAGEWEIDSGSWADSGLWSESGSWPEGGIWSQSGTVLPESGVWGPPSGIWKPRKTVELRRDLLALCRKDRFLHATGLALVALLGAYLAPGQAAAWVEPIASVGLMALAVTAMLNGFGKIQIPVEKRFWGFLASGLSLWIVAILPRSLASHPASSFRGSVLVDTIFLGFYCCLLLALGARPHLGQDWRRRTVGVGISQWGDISFAVVLFLYFVGTSSVLNREIYDTGIPSQLFCLAVGLYLTGLALYYSAISRSQRWRILYRIIAISTLLIAFGNGMKVIAFMDSKELSPGDALELLWILPPIGFVVAARLSRIVWERPLGPGDRTVSVPRDPLGGTSLLLALLTVPIIHLGLYATGMLDPSIRGVREALVFVWLLAQGAAVLLHQVRLQRRNRELRRAGQASQKELRFLVNHDPVTKLPNRAMLLELLEKALARTRRNKAPLALLIVGLEGADDLVSALGREAAEEVLQEMTYRMGDVVRKADFLASYSPLEFAVILESIRKVDDVGLVARKFNERLEGRYSAGGEEVAVTVSIGASVAPGDAFEAESLLRNAVAARTHASPSTCHFYSSEMTRMAVQRLSLEAKLREAIEGGQLRLAYQPKIELTTGRISGFEALARWSDPELGEVSPGRFIPIAEDTGLVLPLGEWALREACQQLVSWRDAGHNGITVAVNLSIRQFEAGDLALQVRTILDETGLDSSALELELTESLAMSEVEKVRETLERFDLEGIRLALDDFGTGFSSMSHLAELPFHSLKIDRSFVRRIGQGSKDDTLVATMVLMARQLGLNVVAEGIETAVQRDFLEGLDCDEGQGFLFRPGVPANEALELLRENRESSMWRVT